MAVEYPIDLSALKRQIDDAEKMINDTDISGLTALEAVTKLKNAIEGIESVYNAGIEDRKNEFNSLIDKVVEIGNDLKAKIDAFGDISQTDIESLSSQLTQIRNLLEGDAAATIIKTLDVIADEVNSRVSVATFPVSISDNTGEATVDISSLGLAASTDYAVTVTQDASGGYVPVMPVVEKVDGNSFKVIAYDLRHFAENKVKWDGTNTAAKFTASVKFVKPQKISVTLTETDGDSAVVGE